MIAMARAELRHRLQFILGLPALRDGPLWRAARQLAAPVMISANALSRWRVDANGLRHWTGFDTRNLRLVGQRPVWLDGGGFVAAVRYREFPWGVDDYLDLCAAAPWRGFFSQDWCVEPQITHDRHAVLDRMSGTVRLNVLCRNGARRRAIEDRFCPVLQGWHPHDYLRCLERMPFALDYPIIGVGSMCRRPVGGPHGILAVVDTLDRALAGERVSLHLFGCKSDGIAALRGHPRIASADSQAWGVHARQAALKAGHSKTDAFLACVMIGWYRRQIAALARPDFRLAPNPGCGPQPDTEPMSPIEARIAAAAEELRRLHESGELDWNAISPLDAYAFAFLDDDDAGIVDDDQLPDEPSIPA